MLAIHERCPPRENFDAELLLPFELRQKTRLRTKTTAGEEAGLFLARGSVLRGGDFLQAVDGRLVKVTAKPENVLHVNCADPVQLARIAYHLGNRHVALQIGAGWLRISNDYVLAQMIEGLGATALVIEAPFEPESGAYGAHRHEGTDAPIHQGIIHQYVAAGS